MPSPKEIIGRSVADLGFTRMRAVLKLSTTDANGDVKSTLYSLAMDSEDQLWLTHIPKRSEKERTVVAHVPQGTTNGVSPETERAIWAPKGMLPGTENLVLTYTQKHGTEGGTWMRVLDNKGITSARIKFPDKTSVRMALYFDFDQKTGMLLKH